MHEAQANFLPSLSMASELPGRQLTNDFPQRQVELKWRWMMITGRKDVPEILLVEAVETSEPWRLDQCMLRLGDGAFFVSIVD